MAIPSDVEWPVENGLHSPQMTAGNIGSVSEKEHLQHCAVGEKRVQTSAREGAHEDTSTIVEPDPAHAEPDLERAQSVKEPLVRVPRLNRRGLFARLAAIPEVTEPFHYANTTKWFITFIVAVAGAAAPVGSAIILPTLDQVTREFSCDPTTTNLSVALYMLSMAIFPLWWSAFSETLGRRTIYLASFALFAIFGALSAVSSGIRMLVVTRLMNGGAAASVQAVGAGTIADLWEPFERGRAMGYFYLGPLMGPLLAPIVGGALGQAFSWRATQWALAIYGLVVWMMILFALPETLKNRKDMAAAAEVDRRREASRPDLTRMSTNQSVQQRSKQYARVLRMLLIDPLSVLAYLRFPLVLLCVYYSAVTFGSLYVLNISVQYTFERQPYEFSTLVIGLLYVPNSIGYILASSFGGKWMDQIMLREARKRRKNDEALVLLAEDRMRENALLGALVYPTALIWYGWTVEKGLFWLVPVSGNHAVQISTILAHAGTAPY